MNTADVEQFRKEFKTIVRVKGEIVSKSLHVTDLYRWDKNGSHANAIERAEAAVRTKRDDFKSKLKGKSYEDWKAMSRKISYIQARRKKAVAAMEKCDKELEGLTF